MSIFNIKKIKSIWNEYGYEIVVLLVVIFIIALAVERKIHGKTGTWSKSFRTELALVSKTARNTYMNNPTQYGYKTGGSTSKGEIECRKILREIFGREFNKVRPSFLRNYITDGDNNLEIDCYDDMLKLGVEYNGAQHYKYIPFFHKTKDAFYNQKYRDDMKRRLCKDVGIRLIEVPYTVPIENIRSYLITELKRMNIIR